MLRRACSARRSSRSSTCRSSRSAGSKGSCSARWRRRCCSRSAAPSSLSLTLVPVLASLVLRGGHERETWLLRAMHRAYHPALGAAMRQRGDRTRRVGVLVLRWRCSFGRRVGAEFVPQLDEGDVLVEARRLPGVALTESVATDRRLQVALLEVPEVAHVVVEDRRARARDRSDGDRADRRLHRAQAGEPVAQGDDQGGRRGRPWPKRSRRTSPSCRSGSRSRSRCARTSWSRASAPTSRSVYGPDLVELQRVAQRIAAVVRRVSGAVDVRVEQGTGFRTCASRPTAARSRATGSRSRTSTSSPRRWRSGTRRRRARGRAALRDRRQARPRRRRSRRVRSCRCGR